MFTQRCELSVGCCGTQEHIHQDYANNTLLTPCRGPDCWGTPQEVQVMHPLKARQNL